MELNLKVRQKRVPRNPWGEGTVAASAWAPCEKTERNKRGGQEGGNQQTDDIYGCACFIGQENEKKKKRVRKRAV